MRDGTTAAGPVAAPADSCCLSPKILNNLPIMRGNGPLHRFTRAEPVPHLRRA